MQIIEHNPYRVLGVLSNSTLRERERVSRRIKQYFEVGQSPDLAYNFQILGALKNSVVMVDVAMSHLSLEKDRLLWSLLWFYKGYEITDEPAFDALNNNNTAEAISIWSKLVIADQSVTLRSSSAFINLSTILLHQAFALSTVRTPWIEKALQLKLSFIESDVFSTYKELIADKTYKCSVEELQLSFLELVKENIISLKDFSEDKFIDIISKLKFVSKSKYFKQISEKDIQFIDDQIFTYNEKLDKDTSRAKSACIEVYNSTLPRLKKLEENLGQSSYEYRTIADKVAEFVLSCAVLHYDKNTAISVDTRYADAVLLIKHADRLAASVIVKKKCQDRLEFLEQRKQEDKVSSEISKINEEIKKLHTRVNTMTSINSFLGVCQPLLSQIERELGGSDEVFLIWTTNVAAVAQSEVITIVNEAQDNLEYKLAIDRIGTFIRLKTLFKDAWKTTYLIGLIKMTSDYRLNRYNPNRATLRKLCVDLGLSPKDDGSTGSTSSINTGGSGSPRPSYQSTKLDDDNSGCVWTIVVAVVIFIIAMIVGK